MLRNRPRARRALWATAGLFAAFSLFFAFALPPLVKAQVEARLTELTGRRVTVGEVRANPFTLAVTVRAFEMREREGPEVFFAFDELDADFAWTSVFRLAPVTDSLRLVRPRLRLVRNADLSYNLQDLIDRPASPSPTAEAGPPGFSLNNIELVGGRINFDDRAEGARHEVTELHVGLPFLSTLGYAAEIKVQPFLAGKVNGSPFGLRGETTPFKDGSATVLRIDLDRVPLPRYLDYLPERLPVRIPSAELSANLVVNFNLRGGRPERISLSGDTRLRKLVVQHRGGAPLAQVEEILLGLDSVDLVARRAEVREVRVSAPALRLRRARDGSLGLPDFGRPAAKPAAGTTEKPWQAVIGRFQVAGGRVEVQDEVPAKPVRLRLQDIALLVQELSNAPNTQASVQLGLNDGAGAKLAYQGTLQATPLKSSGKAQLQGLALRAFQPYVEAAAALEVRDGVLDAAAQIDAQQGDRALEVRVSGVDLALKALRLHHPAQKEPFLRVPLLEVRGASADLPAQSVEAGRVLARDLTALVRREPDGTLSLQRIIRQQGGDVPASEPTVPWKFHLSGLKLERATLLAEDRALREPASHELRQIGLEVEGLGNAPGSKGRVAARMQVNRTGRLEAKGEVGLDPPTAKLQIAATALPLAALDPYAAELAAVRVGGGGAFAQGELEFARAEGADLVLKYRGSAGVSDFTLSERDTAQDLMRWKSLRLTGMSLQAVPPVASVDEIALTGFFSRMLIHADGQINLQKLRRVPAAPAAATAPPPQAAPQLRVGRIVLQGGDVDFTDLFIKPNVSARITGVTGAIGEMNPQQAGEVEIRGHLDSAAPLEILGRVNPFGKELDLNLDLSVRGVDLPTLTPYAVKYAGYGIEKGKLTMELHYEIKERKLAAENSIVLDQLTFGERVESPDATKLPVLLAVALLKDSDGVIDIDLPISGSLDDPQFSVGGLILKVIGNLIGKALTSPFALLGAASGGGEDLTSVEFAPGAAALDAAAVKRLEALAKALANRPALKLEIAGRADAAADGEGMKKSAVLRQVKAQKQRDTGAAGRPEDLSLSAEEYAKYLPAAYGDAKIPDKPRNFIGIAKDIPAAEMEALMLGAVAVGDEELRRLAIARAQETKDWLMRNGKLPAERLFVLAPRFGAADLKGGGTPTRAEFSLSR